MAEHIVQVPRDAFALRDLCQVLNFCVGNLQFLVSSISLGEKMLLPPITMEKKPDQNKNPHDKCKIQVSKPANARIRPRNLTADHSVSTTNGINAAA